VDAGLGVLLTRVRFSWLRDWREFAACVALFSLCGLSCISIARAESGDLLRLSETEWRYVDAMSRLLDAWERKEIELTRDVFDAEFPDRIALFKHRTPTSVIHALFPTAFFERNARLLPSRLVAEIPLSNGARLTLLASVADAAPLLERFGVKPTADDLLRKLPFALFVTLGAAQLEAKSHGKAEVDAASIKRGEIDFFSMGWPFCCAVESD
jgi:hypothetical protein